MQAFRQYILLGNFAMECSCQFWLIPNLLGQFVLSGLKKKNLVGIEKIMSCKN